VTLALLVILWPPAPALAETGGEGRARQDYMLNCQGCHQPDGTGTEGRVPNMKDFVGYYLRVPGGRDFLVRVPGAANSPLGDAELAAVMNWVLRTFSSGQLPEDFKPYSAEEVAALRDRPLLDVSSDRRSLIARISAINGVRLD